MHIMLTAIQSLSLGIVEGLTEFLPVSSSGHLILVRELFGVNSQSGLAFDAVLQLGTILAVYIYFRRDVWNLILAAWNMATGAWRKVSQEEQTLLYGIILGTVPALVLGLLLQKAMDTIFRSALLVACTLIAGSLLFFLAEHYARLKHHAVSVKQAWWIGCFQVLALVPGVSRSGSTISGGLFLGLKRETATRFSFLLSLPIITGSGLLKLWDIHKHGATDFTWFGLALGFAASFAVGYLCIAWLIKYLKNNSLKVFAWYRIALAFVVLAILAVR